jgi:hypothetical protein
MADITTTTPPPVWRIIGIAYATEAHLTSYIRNKNAGMPRFVVEEGTENEMRDRFSVLKRVCPVIELYNNNGVVERHDEVLDVCAKTMSAPPPTESEIHRAIAQRRSPRPRDSDIFPYKHIGKLMFRI